LGFIASAIRFIGKVNLWPTLTYAQLVQEFLSEWTPEPDTPYFHFGPTQKQTRSRQLPESGLVCNYRLLFDNL